MSCRLIQTSIRLMQAVPRCQIYNQVLCKAVVYSLTLNSKTAQVWHCALQCTALLQITQHRHAHRPCHQLYRLTSRGTLRTCCRSGHRCQRALRARHQRVTQHSRTPSYRLAAWWCCPGRAQSRDTAEHRSRWCSPRLRQGLSGRKSALPSGRHPADKLLSTRRCLHDCLRAVMAMVWTKHTRAKLAWRLALKVQHPGLSCP